VSKSYAKKKKKGKNTAFVIEINISELFVGLHELLLMLPETCTLPLF